MSETRQDCADVYPSDPGKPWYNQCWGFRQLPETINFEVGGFGGTFCPPAGSYSGVMTRMGPCSFVYEWHNNDFGIALYMNENTPPLSDHIDQSGTDLLKWRVGGTMSETSKTAYCVMTNPPMGKVRLEIAGTIANDVCSGNFRIWVEET